MDFLVAEETVGYGPCLEVDRTSPRHLNLVPSMHQILADATKMTVIATVFVYRGGSRALMSFSSSFSCRTSSSKRSRREGAGAEAIEGPVIDSSVRAGIVAAPLNRCA